MKRAALDKKDMLNPKEASIYFGIPEMKLRAYLKARPNLECISYFGSRILIDRNKFEKYRRTHSDVPRRVKNGQYTTQER